MKFDTRARRELLVSLRDGILVGGIQFSTWFVALSLFADEMQTGRGWLVDLTASMFGRHVFLAIVVCGITAGVVTALRIRGFILARMNPSHVELFAKLTDGLPGMLYQYRQYPTGRGSVTYASSAIRSIYEMEPEAARQDGTKILDLVHPDDRERIWKALVQSHMHLTPWMEEYRVILPKAGICWRYAHAHVERLPDGGTLWHGFIMDLTKEKTAGLELAVAKKKAEAANLAKSRFLAMMSHDIRTPMNGIVGFATLLRNTPLQDMQREYLTAIEQCSESLLCLVNDILDLSKIEAGRLTIEPTPFALVPCLKEILTTLRPRAQEKGLALALELGDFIPPGIETDRTRLVQILINLLGNAVKFTDEGRVTLRVSCARAADSELPAQWTFAVADTGPGIPPEEQDRIFESFHQVDGAHQREGSGLGLAITRHLCQQLGGEVELASVPGEGTTFTARILAPVAKLAAPASIPSESLRPRAFPNLHALVVDDHPLNAKLAGIMLRRAGCRTQLVHDAAAAISACASERFDIVFMDLEMPQINGLEATLELRRLETGGQLANPEPLYIVALTANVMPEDRRACLEAGMNDYLEKPLREQELHRALEALQHAGATAFDCKDHAAA